MGKTHLQQMQDQMITHFGTARGQQLSSYMEKEYHTLSEIYATKPKAFQRHMHNNIFPVVCTFRALMADGMERGEAADLAKSSFLELMKQPADGLRKMMKFPGLYRAMPWIWKTVMPKMFGEDAGFRFHYYPTDNHQVKFDMTECPYFTLCKELDCLDIAPVFCETDDVCYGHMHPKLIWNRTKTIGKGGDVCDFDLYIPQK